MKQLPFGAFHGLAVQLWFQVIKPCIWRRPPNSSARPNTVRAWALLTLIALSSCAHRPAGKTLVLDYEAFGPQIIASEIIGMQWWQWNSHGGPREQNHDIRVVVYHGIPLEQAMELYPVNQTLQQDYRYVSRQKALGYLDDKIEQNILEDVTERLKATRAKIISGF